jgi:hypothetical protein
MQYMPVPANPFLTWLQNLDRSTSAKGYRLVVAVPPASGNYVVYGTYRNFRVASRVRDLYAEANGLGSVVGVVIPGASLPTQWLYCD